MDVHRTVYRIHAIQRMFERGIAEIDIEHVLMTGEIIEEYLDDEPYPSRLTLGFCGSRPLHMVSAENLENDEAIIITAYEPNPKRWDVSFRRRKTQ